MRPAKIACSAAGTLHPSLKVRGGPIFRQPSGEEELDNVGLSPSDPTGRYACFQIAAGVGVVRVFLVSISHLWSLRGLLENDYELDVFTPDRLKFLIYDPKTAVGRKQRFLLMKIGRQPPNCSRT